MHGAKEVMTDKEYREMARITFPYLIDILHQISFKISKLDKDTYYDRLVVDEIKRGKRTVKRTSVTPLTDTAIRDCLKELMPTIKMALCVVNPLTVNAWNLNQILDFISSSKQPNAWETNAFSCLKDRYNITVWVSSCIYALKYCMDISYGDGIMDTVNSMFAYVASQVRDVLEKISV